jgi:type IV secretory pathway VirB10-like protein
VHKKKAWPRRHPVLTGVIAVGAIVAAAAAGSSGGGSKPSTHATTVSNSVPSNPPAQSAPKHTAPAAPKHTAPAPAAPKHTAPAPAAPKHTAPAPAPAAPKHTAPAAPTYTAAEQNAIQAAQNYLSMDSGFSRAGLIQQLSSKYGSGFTTADATFAVDHIKVDWNQQAVLAAKNYLSMGTGFSRAGLIQQLSSKYGSQFTLAQATYAANKVGL